LVREVGPASWQALDDLVSDGDELDRETVDVETLMVELV